MDTEAGQTVSHTGAHAEGNGTQAYGNFSHAEGNDTLAYGDYSHVEGEGTVAGSDGQHVFGRYNIRDAADTYAEIVGNGSGANSRANARTLDWDGNETLAGGLSAGDDSQIAGDLTVTGALSVGDAATTRDNLGFSVQTFAFEETVAANATVHVFMGGISGGKTCVGINVNMSTTTVNSGTVMANTYNTNQVFLHIINSSATQRVFAGIIYALCI